MSATLIFELLPAIKVLTSFCSRLALGLEWYHCIVPMRVRKNCFSLCVFDGLPELLFSYFVT